MKNFITNQSKLSKILLCFLLLSSVILCFPQKAWADTLKIYKPDNSSGAKSTFFDVNKVPINFQYFNGTVTGGDVVLFQAVSCSDEHYDSLGDPELRPPYGVQDYFGVYTGLCFAEYHTPSRTGTINLYLKHEDADNFTDNKVESRKFTVYLPEHDNRIDQLIGVVDVWDKGNDKLQYETEHPDHFDESSYVFTKVYPDNPYKNPVGIFEQVNNNTLNLIDFSATNDNFLLSNVMGVYSAKSGVTADGNKVNIFGGTVAERNKIAQWGPNEILRDGAGLYADSLVAGVFMKNGGKATNNSINLIGKDVEYKDFLTPYEITTLGFTGDNARNKIAPKIDVPLYVVVGNTLPRDPKNNNTLEIYGYGSTVSKEIHSESMDKMVFHISDALTFNKTDKVMLTYTGTEKLAFPEYGVSVVVDSAPNGYADDGTLTLIKTTNSTIEGEISAVKVEENNIIEYDLEPYFDDETNKTKLMLKVNPEVIEEVDFSENGILLLETRAEDAAVVNNTTEFFLSQAMNQAEFAVMGTEKAKVIPFTALGGNLLKQKTGNYINTIGWNGVGGGAVKMNKTVLAAAAEYGRNKYDAYLSKDYVASGIVQTVGGALLASGNYDSGSHFDAVVHGGWLLSDYLDKEAGLKFNDSTAYLSVAGGYGHEIALSKADFLDIYGRGSYAITFGSKTNVMNADGGSNKVVFDAVNSVRLLADIGYKRHFRSGNELHVDSAYQFEFVGKASGAVYSNLLDKSFNPDSPSLTGSTGMLKVGYNLNFSEYIALDTYITGWLGKQNGMIGGLTFMCHF